MISFIRGILAEKADGMAVLETASGIGLAVQMPANAIDALPGIGEEAKVYTHFQVRDDGMSLFGFCNREDRQMFRQLIGVGGVGPKAALGLLSVIPADELRFAVLAEDTKTIAKAPGIGTKTARKIILELKDKLSLEEAVEWKQAHLETASGREAQAAENGAASEAVMALAALGYSNAEALRAVSRIEGTETMEVEEILKAALRQMNR